MNAPLMLMGIRGHVPDDAEGLSIVRAPLHHEAIRVRE